MTEQRKPLIEVPLKEHVKGQVTFQFYRKGQLYYETETGLIFPVPIDDTQDATFLDVDKAIYFMRYIKKHLKDIETADFKEQKT